MAENVFGALNMAVHLACKNTASRISEAFCIGALTFDGGFVAVLHYFLKQEIILLGV